ncbi:SLAM family member 8 [Pyxicephalus adspersus]|uniref:SLAM family member 8 n=1 Tax=Pyxicephalus adspersus TaxID=30357 RepID=UPI003B5A2271
MLQLSCFILLHSILRAALTFQNTVDVISAEERDVILTINEKDKREVFWIFSNNHIATTWLNGKIEIKNHRFTRRLLGMDGGSLKITQVTREDQGTYSADMFGSIGDDVVHWKFHLKVYPILQYYDINIHVNMISNETCSLALTCLTNLSNANVFWNDPKTNDTYIRDSTLYLYDISPNITYTCTVENPVSNVSKTITPRNYCQEEGHTAHQEIDGSAQKWIVFITIVAFLIFIIPLILYYKRRRRQNLDSLMKEEVSTICDKVPLSENSPSYAQSQVCSTLSCNK